jgi:hypothetical protein
MLSGPSRLLDEQHDRRDETGRLHLTDGTNAAGYAQLTASLPAIEVRCIMRPDSAS